MSLSPTTRTRIETLLAQNPVVLFMKGSPQAPQCGFSAAASGVLNELLPQYATVNVLEDPEIRDGIKEYGNWPTIPQLYVKGELVGGADIVQSMYNSGELQALFGLPKPDRTPPQITITDTAAQAIRSALADAEPGLALHLSIDARFQPQFHLAEPADVALLAGEARAEVGGDDLGRGARADHARAEAEHVDVVVLDALVRRMHIVADRGADALHLVGADRGADAGAADHQPALDLARGDGGGDLARDVREVDRRGIVGADVEHLVALVLQEGEDLGFHRKAGMVRADDELHERFPLG